VASFTGEPLFVSEAPVAVRIDPSDVNSALLKLVRNGRLNVGHRPSTNRVSPYLVGTAPGEVLKVDASAAAVFSWERNPRKVTHRAPSAH